jgi:hypothetical protein
MKRSILLIIFCLLAGRTLADDAPKPPTVEEITATANDTIAALQQQRNTALDQAAQLQARVVKDERELNKARDEIAQLKQSEAPKQ